MSDNRAVRRFMVKLFRMVNRVTGQVLDVDPAMKRVRHLGDRLRAWCDTASMVLGDFRLVLVTLTYAPGEVWQADDFSAFINKMSHFLGDNLLTYCWVDELMTAHRQGVPHYHCLLMVRRGVDVPAPDTSLMWSKGSSKRQTWDSVYYLLQYAKKQDQKGLGEFKYPSGARIFGASWRHLRVIALQQGEKVREYAVYVVRLTMLPRWVKDLCKSSADLLSVRHLIGGGWALGDHVYKSPWRLQGVIYGEC
jgi:hypothetical protein